MMQQSEYITKVQRDDGSFGNAELVAAFEQGIADLRSAVAGMNPEQVHARPVPGKWSTVECVGHLADTEIFFTDRIVRTVAMDRPLLMSADEEQYLEIWDESGALVAQAAATDESLVLAESTPRGWVGHVVTMDKEGSR